ncbi:MAG TPA: aminopeptidase P family protein, partial [Burkholderiales bacterium]|nr:aminopeptidase P family protein [Burkholderiales bacterium]
MALTPFPPTAVPLPEGARATRVPSKYVPQLSVKERDRRWDRARKAMLMAGIDAFVFLGNDIYWGMGMANMRYMFQVDAHLGADAVFPLSGEPVVWSGVPHMNRPTNPYLSINTWITDFRTRGGMAAVADEVRARGLDKSKLGLIGFSSTIQT